MKIADDGLLLRRMQQGEHAAMELFYRRESAYLFAVCCRYLSDEEDARDVLQESFVRIFQSVGAFEIREDGSLRAWATRIVVNRALKFLRKRRLTFVSVEEEDIGDIPDATVEKIPAEIIQRLIEELPTGYRTVFNLFAIEQWGHKEIAKMLGISESTSASQYHRARRMLKKRIAELISDD